MNHAASESNNISPKRSCGIFSLAKTRKEVAVEINDLLQVQIPDDPNSPSYRSRVDDIVDNMILIAWPTDRGVLIPLHENHTLTLSFVRDDAVYVFTGIIEQIRREPFPQLSVSSVRAPERIQRRQFFRVKSVLPVELLGQLPGSEKDNGAPEAISLKTHTHDISGSGLSIRQNVPIPAGTLMTARLSLPGDRAPIRIACKVVHCSLVSILADRPSHHIGIQFLLINEADRTRIVQHVVRFEVGQAGDPRNRKESEFTRDCVGS